MEPDIPLAPIAGWTIAPVSAYGAVMLTLQYLTHATQQPGEAQHTPHLVMHAAQARQLIAALQSALAKLETEPPEGTGLPKH